jgi:CRP-like cAMP-binding protein
MLTRAELQYSRQDAETILRRVPLFSGIESASISALAQAARRVDYRKGQTICQVGQSAESFFVVVSGLIKRARVSYGGQEKVLELMTAGQAFGDTELFAEKEFAAQCSAVDASVLVSIAGDTMRRVVSREPVLSVRLMQRLANRQLELESEMVAHQSKSGNERVLEFLLQQSGGETDVRFPASKQLIASRIGLTPETLSRALRDLAEAGLLVVNGRSVYLQNAQIALHRRAQGESAIGVATSSPSSTSSAPQRNRPCQVGNPDYPNMPSPLAIINMAGRQRMLAQRMAKSWLMLGRGVVPVRAQHMLRQSIALFESQSSRLSDFARSEATRAACGQARSLWQPFKALLETLPSESGAQRLFAANEEILVAGDRLTLAYASAEADRGSLINLAGRQRMLTQRMATFYMFQHWGIEAIACNKGLASARQEFKAALAKLSAAAIDHPRIEAQLIAVSRQWSALQAALDSPRGVGLNANAARVATTSERLVQQLDAAVCLYETLAESWAVAA